MLADVVLIKIADVVVVGLTHHHVPVGLVDVPENVHPWLDFLYHPQQYRATDVHLLVGLVSDSERRNMRHENVNLLWQLLPHLLLSDEWSSEGHLIANPHMRSCEDLNALYLDEIMAKVGADCFQLLDFFGRVHPLCLRHLPAMTDIIAHIIGWLQPEVMVASHDYLVLVGQPTQELSEILEFVSSRLEREVTSMYEDVRFWPGLDIYELVVAVRIGNGENPDLPLLLALLLLRILRLVGNIRSLHLQIIVIKLTLSSDAYNPGCATGSATSKGRGGAIYFWVDQSIKIIIIYTPQCQK